MKIGILTFHRSVNNGAVMQAYSLSKRLADEYPGIKIEIIDFHMKKVMKSYHYNFFNYIRDSNIFIVFKKIVKLFLNPMIIYRLNKRTKIFDNSINILPLSGKKIISDSTNELVDYINSRYQILIVGSDAVWNYVTRGFPNAYFPDQKIKIAKLSYAASCYGMEFYSYCENNKLNIKKILNDFYFIGVRDKATEDFVKWCDCTKKPYHTCDPTAFLDLNNLPIDIERLKSKLEKKGFDFNKPTIGLMGNEKMCSMLRNFFGKKYQIVALYEYVKKADVNLYDLTPYEWAYVFKYFKITFTTYFHGTMLSLRNGIPVICISLKTDFSKKHDSKTLDLLKRLNYSDWYFSTDYKKENFDSIKNKALELLSKNIRNEILNKMNDEAQSFYVFKNELDKLINNYKKGEL